MEQGSHTRTGLAVVVVPVAGDRRVVPGQPPVDKDWLMGPVAGKRPGIVAAAVAPGPDGQDTGLVAERAAEGDMVVVAAAADIAVVVGKAAEVAAGTD